MSYIVEMGDIAERHDERTGENFIYSVRMVNHSGYDEEYVICVRREGSTEPAKEIMNLWSSEAQRLADILTGKTEREKQ